MGTLPFRSLTRQGSLAMAAPLVVVLVAGLALADTSPAAAANGPTVITGSKFGPLNVPSPKVRTLARLALPKGRWYVTATADLYATARAGVNCRLKLGKRSDRVSATPGSGADAGFAVAMLLTVAGPLKDASRAALKCVGESPGVQISDIKISAVRVGRLTTLGIGPAATSGSGKPVVISGRRADDDVNGDGSYHSVATLPLPSGKWWIVAKAVGLGTNDAGIFSCRLTAGQDYDELHFGLKPRFGPSDTLPLGLQVVHRFGSAGSAELQCTGPHDFDVNDVVITAMRAGKLTNRRLSDGDAVHVGTGWPRVISGWLDGPTTIPVGLQFQTIASLPLPKGRWMAVAKLWFEGASVPADFFRAVCRIRLSKGKDFAIIEYEPDVTRVGPMVMSLALRTKHAGALKLQCIRFPGGGSSDAYFVKLTALKAGNLVKKGL